MYLSCRARPYHRMKLMLVGKAGRGKTTLLKKISEKGQSGIQANLFLSRMSEEARRYQKDLSTGTVLYELYTVLIESCFVYYSWYCCQ